MFIPIIENGARYERIAPYNFENLLQKFGKLCWDHSQISKNFQSRKCTNVSTIRRVVKNLKKLVRLWILGSIYGSISWKRCCCKRECRRKSENINWDWISRQNYLQKFWYYLVLPSIVCCRLFLLLPSIGNHAK